jgi:hypothetical protein
MFCNLAADPDGGQTVLAGHVIQGAKSGGERLPGGTIAQVRGGCNGVKTSWPNIPQAPDGACGMTNRCLSYSLMSISGMSATGIMRCS